MAKLQTGDLSQFPDVPSLKRLMKSLAMLDAILSPDWELRYHSFNAHWSVAEEMGSMRNGSGDEIFALFSPDGCFLKGFAHEGSSAEVDPTSFYSQLPSPFSEHALEPAFSPANVTFCYWRGPTEPRWHSASVPFLTNAGDGSEDLLLLFGGDPVSYQKFAAEYYERELPLSAIELVYGHEPLSPALVNLLNASAEWEELRTDAEEIGYPWRADDAD